MVFNSTFECNKVNSGLSQSNNKAKKLFFVKANLTAVFVKVNLTTFLVKVTLIAVLVKVNLTFF